MTIKQLLDDKIMYIDDDFVIFNQNNVKLYDNRNCVSAELADYTQREISRIRHDTQYGLIIKVW